MCDDTMTHYVTKSSYDWKLGSPNIYLHIYGEWWSALKEAVQLCIYIKRLIIGIKPVIRALPRSQTPAVANFQVKPKCEALGL